MQLATPPKDIVQKGLGSCRWWCAGNPPQKIYRLIDFIAEITIRYLFDCITVKTHGLATLTTFLGCPSCIWVTKECYQTGFLEVH